MIPKKYDAHEYDYPDFQADQVLSADHLNHAFSFNDQQERLTRTNLIGLGIVCGLKATKSADGKTVTISKGTGITSQGYLIVHGKENSEESIDYKKYRSFSSDILKEKKYDVLVSGAATKYPIWELLDATEAKGTDPDLTEGFLNTKACLLFYEMLEVDAKNCDTTSCDDKGKTVTITVRKLLVNVTDADQIILELNTKAQMSGSGEIIPGISSLPEVRLPRFDVVATSLETTSDIYKAYQKVFTKTFVEATGNALNAAYGIFKTYLKDNSNPFANFNTSFAFLHNATIEGNDLLHFQYYWDFFCDLINAYNEWRLAAQFLGSLCTPPETLFPRHLFLCHFGEAEGVIKSKYRNYFIPSPVMGSHERNYKEFRSLFQRLTRLITTRSFPAPAVVGTATADTNIRITPSLLGNYPLGNRAIPYYYKNNESTNKLVDVWNYEATSQSRQQLILSYKPSYNTTDDFVINPLRYDLESYNFFRVEGHIGKPYAGVLANLKKLIADNRLPIDVVALELSNDASNTKADEGCSITNIQMQFDLLKAELKCCLKKNLAFWGQLVISDEPDDVRDIGDIIRGSGIRAIVPEREYILNVNERSSNVTDTLKEFEKKYRAASNPAVANEVKKLMSLIKDSPAEASTDTRKAKLIKDTISIFPAESLAGKYLDFQKDREISIGATPKPATTFNSQVLEHYALIIIDELSEILSLLSAIDPLQFDLVKFAEHIEALKKAYETLGGLLSSYLKVHKAVYTVKATVGEALNSKVDAIAAAMPEILEKNAGTIILLLLNPPDSTSTNNLITNLKQATTNEAKQKVIDAAFSKVDKDGVMIPAKKEINYIEDPVLRDINDRLKNLSCLCGHESFKILHDLLQKEIDALKQYNLFSKFVKKHPGIQHKAGVPTGGTFIIAYHRKGTVSAPAFEKAIKTMNDGVVVADFYLPYLCTSDCQPINFNVTVPAPAVSVSLEKQEFCSEDSTPSYLFNTNPTGGKLATSAEQKDSLKDNGDGTFSFLPGKVVIAAGAKDATVSYTYTLGDQMQTITVKVYAFPKVKIVAKADAVNPLKVDFTFDNPAVVSNAAWLFGDGSTASGITASHTYARGGSYTISASVQNGVCSFVPENMVVDVKDLEAVVIGLKITEICRDAAPINFTVSPKGGSFSGEGFTESPEKSGKFTFTPSSVASDGTPQKLVTFNYTPLAGSPASTSVTVFETSQGADGFDVITGDKTDGQFVFTGFKNARILEVDFGDGSPKASFDVSGLTDFKTPSHLFPGAGPFTVSAVLINGTCSFEFTALVVRFRQVDEFVKVCQPLGVPASVYSTLRRDIIQEPIFMRLYTQRRFEEVDLFFGNLVRQLSQNPAVPLSFFTQNVLDPIWIDALPINERTRFLSIRLLAVLSDVATTLSCLKDDDINTGISTLKFFESIIAKLPQLQQLGPNDKPLIKSVVDDIDDELKRLENNREKEKKVAFSDVMERILKTIKDLP